MFTTTKEGLAAHLSGDLGLKKGDLVFLHSGLIGLGQLDNGLDTITDAFSDVLGDGLLVVPAFSYSWCQGKAFDPAATECPASVGGYSQGAWKDRRFLRSTDPNFSVAALKNGLNGNLIEQIFDIGRSCFGEQSVFDHMYQVSGERDGYIMLLGGAHNDCLFRTTFIHYVEELVGVPYRYRKRFTNPQDPGDYVEQYVRFLTEEEYRQVTGEDGSRFAFPITFDYTLLGNGLVDNGLIKREPFGFSETRMVGIRNFCDFLKEQLIQAPDFCLRREDISYAQKGR